MYHHKYYDNVSKPCILVHSFATHYYCTIFILQAAKIPVKYAHAPTARCAPSTLIPFVDHLTFEQRRRINGMGFGGLLRVSADRLESRELLKFLFDRIDPRNMVIMLPKTRQYMSPPSPSSKCLSYQTVVKTYISKHTTKHRR